MDGFGMNKNWVGISVIGCAAASLLMLGGAWKKQHEMVQLELKERDSKHWIENDYVRRDRVKDLDEQSKVLALGSAGLISWPFLVMFYLDVADAGARARVRRIKKRLVQRTK